MSSPKITVIVPTRDRPRSLERCLAALDRQTAGDALEVLVVDDSSRGTAKGAADGHRGWRVIRGSCRGAAAARNRGVAEARAPLVLFTDDDCVPSPPWAALLAAALDRQPVAAGRTLSPPGENALGVVSQRMVNYLADSSADELGRMRFAPSNNLGCRTKVARRLPFDDRYPSSGGEDRDWCARLVDSGLLIAIVTGAVVDHHQQLGFSGFLRKHAGYGRGARIFRSRHGSPDTSGVRAFRTRLVSDGFRVGVATGGLVCIAQLATAAGYVGEVLRERRSQPG